MSRKENPSNPFDRNVYILGAGFSAAAGAPLINNFLDVAASLWEDPDAPLSADERRAFGTVFAFRREMSQAREKVRIDLDNVEHLFGLVEIAHRLSPSSQDTKQSILTLIATTLEQTTRGVVLPEIAVTPRRETDWYFQQLPANYQRGQHSNPPQYKADIYSHFASMISGRLDHPDVRIKRHDAVITFNYDLVLDRAVKSTGSRVDYRLDSKNTDDISEGVSIIKLHGSINWAVCEKCGKTMIREPDSKLEQLDCASCNLALRPLLIPPSWNKAGSDSLGADVAATLWSAAADELAHATRICVIGYSIPETDAFFRYLLTLALSRNYHLHSLSVIDPSSAVDAKFQELLEPIFRERRYSYFNTGIEIALSQHEFYRRMHRGDDSAFRYEYYGIRPR